jgi:hypothetical protein
LHVDVNLCATTSEQPASESKQNNHHDDHKDHQNRDDARAAATITMITHEQPPVVGVKDSTNQRGCGNDYHRPSARSIIVTEKERETSR